MKINLFVKTFLMLLISFSLVFIGSMYYSYTRFSPMYIEKNIDGVKQNILSNANTLKQGTSLEDTSLMDLSSETAFIRYQNQTITASIGPTFLTNDNILDFVIGIYDSEEAIQEGSLIYYVDLQDDIYQINYIYQFEFDDYLIVSTRIQSLQNVDQVLNNINITQSIIVFIAIVLLSFIISKSVVKPIQQIGAYAKGLSNLDFNQNLKLKRQDEFRDLVTSLNELTFHLKKAFSELHEANQKLSSDIDYEKAQEEKKKQLIMTINHEIKTPLAVMKGMIEGMIDGVGRYKDKETYLKELLKQIESISTITQDLTYTLRLEDKKTDHDVVSSAFIHTILQPLEELAKQKKIKIQKNLEPASLWMSEELLNILVTNLVKNALSYTTEPWVKIDGSIQSNGYVLVIRNKGSLPEAELTKLFDSFYRLNTQQEKGSGLGLFIVKQICDLYGYPYKLFNDAGDVVFKVLISLK
ncbi:HAMP domain-containing sensor histidine kinase [Paracholeplasma manati]|uniref:HAMP domain-containing sensor histidine kinase n=1 Tax=Paracholeplasma manati TaxID=591373 RepID=UPI002407B8D9|nr:HAMP domain-containing sensor histidine kinase [Paracholeplasma manati]MDG0889148.1 HAMP domain-containing sensor histidine kinase [Paracholeplasma manati]